MTDNECINFIRENGDLDDFLLCKAAVQSGSTWQKEYEGFKEHLNWTEATEAYLRYLDL